MILFIMTNIIIALLLHKFILYIIYLKFKYLMYLMDKYEINNHVNIDDLKDDKTWIHGSSKII